MDSITSAEELELFQLMADAQTTNYIAAAGITLLIFEHIATFSEEVNYVWKSRLSLWSVLYVRIRYFTLIVLCVDVTFMFREMKSSNVCRAFLLAEMVTCTVVSIGVDCVMALRVWILYGKSRRLICVLIPLLTCEVIAMLTFGTLTILPLKEYLNIGPILTGCWSPTISRLFTFYAVPYLLMAILMFSMTLYKCGQHLLATGFARMPVVTLFLRDGVFLFMSIILYGVVEVVLWHNGRPALAQVPIIPATAINAVVGGRILLNIKNLGCQEEVDSDTMPTIRFGNLSRRNNAHLPWYLQTGELSSSTD
ncbi:hypothetical protein C8R44DRAFT_989698 [Mycena epipterygia]|nr:hypothetical protein C8R44DRAFT_989698 [Mycena epipterygia]